MSQLYCRETFWPYSISSRLSNRMYGKTQLLAGDILKNRSAMRTCVAYELPWSQRFFLPLRGSGSLILCREKSRKSSVTGVLNSPFFTYHWNPVDFPVCRFGYTKLIITRLVQVSILKKIVGEA